LVLQPYEAEHRAITIWNRFLVKDSAFEIKLSENTYKKTKRWMDLLRVRKMSLYVGSKSPMRNESANGKHVKVGSSLDTEQNSDSPETSAKVLTKLAIPTKEPSVAHLYQLDTEVKAQDENSEISTPSTPSLEDGRLPPCAVKKPTFRFPQVKTSDLDNWVASHFQSKEELETSTSTPLVKGRRLSITDSNSSCLSSPSHSLASRNQWIDFSESPISTSVHEEFGNKDTPDYPSTFAIFSQAKDDVYFEMEKGSFQKFKQMYNLEAIDSSSKCCDRCYLCAIL